MTTFTTLAAVNAHSFIGIYSADSAAIAAVYAFVENESQSMSDRAAALRTLATNAFGFDGEDDQDYVTAYMNAR